MMPTPPTIKPKPRPGGDRLMPTPPSLLDPEAPPPPGHYGESDPDANITVEYGGMSAAPLPGRQPGRAPASPGGRDTENEASNTPKPFNLITEARESWDSGDPIARGLIGANIFFVSIVGTLVGTIALSLAAQLVGFR